MFKLETERLILRNFTKKDLQGYINLRNDDKFKRFYSESDVTEEKSIFLLEMFMSQANESPRTKYQLAITTRVEELIGSCGIRIEDDKQASIGCELDRKWQASGYAPEAARKLIEFAFNELDIHRVYAETISENKAAIKLCQLLGMRIEGELIENRCFQGRWWDTTILGLLRRDWDSQ